jgi:hypothetical protein
MAEFRDHAVAVAAAINADGYATTRPEVPRTPLFHVHIPAPKDAVAAAAQRILEETGVELPQRPRSSADPTRCSIELTIGVVSLDFTPREVADLIRQLR